jgi:general secretion pathway protein D
MVMLDISQEVSDVAATTTSGIDSPTIKQRKISSSVAIRDGETVALGGLILNDNERGQSGIPLLMDIPLLGNLFRSTTHKVNKTELIVLITPHVVDSTERARTVTEELRRKLPSLEPLLEQYVDPPHHP